MEIDETPNPPLACFYLALWFMNIRYPCFLSMIVLQFSRHTRMILQYILVTGPMLYSFTCSDIVSNKTNHCLTITEVIVDNGDLELTRLMLLFDKRFLPVNKLASQVSRSLWGHAHSHRCIRDSVLLQTLNLSVKTEIKAVTATGTSGISKQGDF